MNDLDLDAIQARIDRATEGPWVARGGEVFRPREGTPLEQGVIMAASDGSGACWEEDADFIAHARQDVPALLARVRQLEYLHEEGQE